MKIEIELNAGDLSVLRSYFYCRQGYIPFGAVFNEAVKMRQCERLAQKLIDAIGGDPFEVEATDEN